MKRTRDNWLMGHPEDRRGISGLRFFDGEDLHYQQRKRAFQETQKRWIEAQLREKELIRQRELEEERLYVYQTRQITRMRGMLEDELANNIRQMQVEIKRFNRQQYKQRVTRDRTELRNRYMEENEDLLNQSRIREVLPYINPLR